MKHLEPRKRSSTPSVVPGAAPALAKAGVGGYEGNLYLLPCAMIIYIYMTKASCMLPLPTNRRFFGVCSNAGIWGV